MKNNNSLLALAKDCTKHSSRFKSRKTTKPTKETVNRERHKDQLKDESIAQSNHYDYGEPLSTSYSDEDYTASFSEEDEVEYMSYEEMPDIVEDLDADSFVEPFDDLSYEHSSSLVDNETNNNSDNITEIKTPEKKREILENNIIKKAAPANEIKNEITPEIENEAPKASIKVPKEDKDTFEDDIKAILSGKKKYDAEQKEVVPAAGSRNPGSARRKQRQEFEPDSGLPDFKKNEHDIFNKIAQNLSYSNAYDLGAIALENRFDKFDEEQDIAETKKKLTS